MNPEVVREIIRLDYPAIASSLEEFLKREVYGRGSDGTVFGLSGGVDSAVTGMLSYRALGERSLAIIMPDSEITPHMETEDALRLVDRLGMEYKMIDIHPIIREYSRYLEPDDRARGNLRARVRASITYYYANSKNLLVLGSSDRSEWLLGYFTKFGDGASDLMPLLSLYKLQVRAMAAYLNVPDRIIRKKSSPHLVKDQLAEEELGLSYEEIDSVLYHTVDRGASAEEAARRCSVGIELVQKVAHMYNMSRHKREAAGVMHT